MTAILFGAITILALLFLYHATGHNRRVVGLFAAWGTAVVLVAATGLFQRHPATFASVLIGGVGCIVWSYRLLRSGPPVDRRWLLAVHVLRIPVEIVLYRLALEGMVPELMTFQGLNYDIITGITAALLLAYIAFGRRRSLGRTFWHIWNGIGLLLLTTIVVLAVLSAPLPLQHFAFDHPNVAVLAAPYCLLPAVVVPVVYLAHLIGLREARAANFKQA